MPNVGIHLIAADSSIKIHIHIKLNSLHKLCRLFRAIPGGVLGGGRHWHGLHDRQTGRILTLKLINVYHSSFLWDNLKRDISAPSGNKFDKEGSGGNCDSIILPVRKCRCENELRKSPHCDAKATQAHLQSVIYTK